MAELRRAVMWWRCRFARDAGVRRRRRRPDMEAVNLRGGWHGGCDGKRCCAECRACGKGRSRRGVPERERSSGR